MTWQAGLYVAAVFLPLIAFLIQFLGVRVLGRANAYVATGAIFGAFVLSLIGFISYFGFTATGVFEHHGGGEAHGPAEPGHGPGDGHGHASAAGDLAPFADDPAAAEAGHGHGPAAWTAKVDWVALGGGVGAVNRFIPALTIPLEVYVDNLTVIMFLMVTFIATLIHLYSMGYMRDDPRYPRFFTYLSLFCFSMLGLVASGNVFMIFVFWELVGVCSYLLIGFWYEDKKNADAANKAFITNRVGDIGMLMGLGLLWTNLGTFNIHEINTSLRGADGQFHASTTDSGNAVALVDRETGATLVNEATGRPRTITLALLTLAGLGIFAGCVGKSAQFPLHVWLPDAMAGPTPVSALIHAATMVAAGVYLVGRFYPVFTPEVLLYIAYTGGITLFVAATIAVVQTDYKKVLAYSTVSQLGFMMLGLGVGGWAAGLFHLITHAFFKALLFLGAGSVYHSVHTYEMPVLGGLQRKMPITAYTMLAATLAISGVPFFSGFYSKDAILAAALYRVTQVPGGGYHFLLFLLPVLGATITAFYMFRMWLLVFAGSPRGGLVVEHATPAAAHGHGHDHDHGHDDAHAHGAAHAAHGGGHGHDHHHDGNPAAHAHESEPIMAWPLLALVIPTIFVGWTWQFGLPIDEPVLEYMLGYGQPVPHADLFSMHYYAMAVSLVIATVGIGLGLLFYAPPVLTLFDRTIPLPRKRFSAKAVADRFPGVYSFLSHKWYFDELYWATLVRPSLTLARGLADFDKKVVDGAVNGAARITSMISRFEGVFDNVAVDGLVKLTGFVTYALGDWGRGLQTGQLRSYLLVLAVAFIGLCTGVFVWVL